jgi:thiol-disulfide isomerase/thioredoxin
MTERSEARRAPEALEPPEEARFADLTLRLGGEERRLFDLEGPIVLDVWATWCGPCTQSLPHLESLARRYEGRVTFVAVSVDEEEEVAARYLERRGGASFRTAWLGADGMARLGIGGIPAMFVFDADHRLVEELSGFGPGSTALDEAVEEALAR